MAKKEQKEGREFEVSDKRYQLDCREAGKGCSLTISGAYEEVLQAGVLHGRQAHSMTGEDENIREDIKPYIKEEVAGAAGLPGFKKVKEEKSFQQRRPS